MTPVNPEEQGKQSWWSEMTKQLDYYFMAGENMDDVISGYRSLTGKSPVMPKWAMGFWQSREKYNTQEEMLGALKGFRDRKIPLEISYWIGIIGRRMPGEVMSLIKLVFRTRKQWLIPSMLCMPV